MFRRLISAALVPLLALMPALLGGCVHSTKYTPKPSNKMRLVVTKGGLGFHKKGITLPAQSSTALHGCNPAASKQAREGGDNLRKGKIYSLIASLTILLGFGLAIVIPLISVSSSYVHSGNADLIDAMNMHNDTLACIAAGGM